jgi:hypothetical protein
MSGSGLGKPDRRSSSFETAGLKMVFQFNVFEKELRARKDLRLQALHDGDEAV